MKTSPTEELLGDAISSLKKIVQGGSTGCKGVLGATAQSSYISSLTDLLHTPFIHPVELLPAIICSKCRHKH